MVLKKFQVCYILYRTITSPNRFVVVGRIDVDNLEIKATKKQRLENVVLDRVLQLYEV